jgi:hypothetical protein
MFKRASGKVKPFHSAKKASTAFVAGVAVERDTDGYITPAGTSTTRIAGIANRVVSTTTTDFVGNVDYALTTDIEFDEIEANDVVEADVTGATLSQTSIGELFDTASDGLSVLASASTNDNWMCIGVISTTKGLFKRNS